MDVINLRIGDELEDPHRVKDSERGRNTVEPCNLRREPFFERGDGLIRMPEGFLHRCELCKDERRNQYGIALVYAFNTHHDGIITAQDVFLDVGNIVLSVAVDIGQ